MATSKENRDKKNEKKPVEADFPRAYIRLRTILDGLETTALRFCLDNKNVTKRLQRIAEIEAALLPIIRGMQDKTLGSGGGSGVCGEGLFNCGGVCVPYQCPDKYTNPRT